MRRYIDLIPVAVAVIVVFCFTVEVPASDDWNLVPIIQKIKAGTLSWTDLNTPFNGHKQIVSYPILSGVAMATHWNTLLMSLFGLTVAFVGWLAIRPEAVRNGRLLESSIVFWNMKQAISWLWPWETTMFLSIALSLWAIRCARGSRLSFAVALILGLLGSLSFGGGLAVWPALLYLARKDRFQLAAVLGVAAVASALFVLPLQNHDHLRFNSFQALPFFLDSVGASVAPVAAGIAVVAGIGALFLAWRLFRSSQEFAFAVCLLGITEMVLLTITRSGSGGFLFGADPRYCTLSMLVWVPFVFAAEGMRRWVVLLIVAGSFFKMPAQVKLLRKRFLDGKVAQEAFYTGSDQRFIQRPPHISPEQIDYDSSLLKEWGYSLYRRHDPEAGAPSGR